MRGILPTDVMASLESGYPNTQPFWDGILKICYPLSGEAGQTQEAQIRLEDGLHTLNEARYALIEAKAHALWYNEYRKPPDELAAKFFRRFYLDDASLRIYSSGEQLVKAIRLYWRLPDVKGRYLLDRVLSACRELVPSHPLIAVLTEIDVSPDWRNNTEYRNNWVHNRRPIIPGLGLSKRITVTPFTATDCEGVTGGVLQFPQTQMEQLEATTEGAYATLFSAFRSVIAIMEKDLGARVWGNLLTGN